MKPFVIKNHSRESDPFVIDEFLIRGKFKDALSNFLYYDRKEDEDLPLDAINDMVRNGFTTKEELIKILTEEITNAVNKIK